MSSFQPARKKGPGLGGASQKESSREELLQKAREERISRQHAKRGSKAASDIQRTWRGYQDRKKLVAELGIKIVQDFSEFQSCSYQDIRGTLIPSMILYVKLCKLDKSHDALKISLGALLHYIKHVDSEQLQLQFDETRTNGQNYCILQNCAALISSQQDFVIVTAATRITVLMLPNCQTKVFHMLVKNQYFYEAIGFALLQEFEEKWKTIVQSLFQVLEKIMENNEHVQTEYFCRFVLIQKKFNKYVSNNLYKQIIENVDYYFEELNNIKISKQLQFQILANLALLVSGTRKMVQTDSGKCLDVFLPNQTFENNPQIAISYLKSIVKQFSLQSQPQSEIPGLEQTFWILTQGLHLQQILRTFQQSSQQPGQEMEIVCEAFAAVATNTFSKRLSFQIINTCAFCTGFLKELWKFISQKMSITEWLEIDQKNGWVTESLRGGLGSFGNLSQSFALFCACAHRQLLIMDDYEFVRHVDKGDFENLNLGLGNYRAISAALNTALFYTCCPTDAHKRPPQPETLLAKQAPALLRHLYDRDVRHTFCRTDMWLQPYNEWTAQVLPHSQNVQHVQNVSNVPLDEIAGVLEMIRGRHESKQSDINFPDKGESSNFPVEYAFANLLIFAPQCVPYMTRVEIFRKLLDKHNPRVSEEEQLRRPAIKVSIRRGRVLEDAMAQLGSIGSGIRQRLYVTFINQQGMQEAGMDQGGLMKELLEQVVKIGFDASYGLFTASREGLCYPFPLVQQIQVGDPKVVMGFLGLMLGRALWDSILLDVTFAPFFVMWLQGRVPMFDDLHSMDPEIHKALIQIKQYEGEVEDMCLDFTVEKQVFGQQVVHELIPGGKNIGVTNENRSLYVYLMADWHLNRVLGESSRAFAAGLWNVIPISWLRLFNPKEFNELIGGGEDEGMDLEDLKKHTRYSNGYHNLSPTIRVFWSVMRSLNAEDKKAFLRFVTSCSRPPLGGFAYLSPPFTIHRVDCNAPMLAFISGQDVDRLPSASTCYNMLKLPNYRRSDTLRQKILYAIKSGAGFELS